MNESAGSNAASQALNDSVQIIENPDGFGENLQVEIENEIDKANKELERENLESMSKVAKIVLPEKSANNAGNSIFDVDNLQDKQQPKPDQNKVDWAISKEPESEAEEVEGSSFADKSRPKQPPDPPKTSAEPEKIMKADTEFSSAEPSTVQTILPTSIKELSTSSIISRRQTEKKDARIVFDKVYKGKRNFTLTVKVILQ